MSSSKKHRKRPLSDNETNYSFISKTQRHHDYKEVYSNKEKDTFAVFEQYGYELNKFLKGKDIDIKNSDDFWKFMDKYQVMYRRSQNSQKDETCKNIIKLKYSLLLNKIILYKYL